MFGFISKWIENLKSKNSIIDPKSEFEPFLYSINP